MLLLEFLIRRNLGLSIHQVRNKLRSKKYDFKLSDPAFAEAKKLSGDKPIGPASDEDLVKLRPQEKKKVGSCYLIINF